MESTNSTGYSPASSTSLKVFSNPADYSFEFQNSDVLQSGHHGALASLRHNLRSILKLLLRIKGAWADGMPKRLFELEEVANSLSIECEKLDSHQTTADAWSDSSGDAKSLTKIWDLVDHITGRCLSEAANPLHRRLSLLLYPESTGPLSSPTKRLSPDGFLELLAGYEEMVQALSHHRKLLCPLQTAIQLAKHKTQLRSAREVDLEEGSVLSREALRTAEYVAHETAQRLKGQMDLTSDDPVAIETIKQSQKMYLSWRSMSRNQHFPNRTPANSYYIGQEDELETIRKAFEHSMSPVSVQKRFVIQGQPGSGKTELALKYATEYMAQFWGVFWVDASSNENATQSFIEMAKLFGENTTEQAAKQFLANRHPMHPWLLIIDNADDDDVSVEKLFPPGDKGHVLVTTRNPAKASLGTVGENGYLELNVMREGDAIDLLLTAARKQSRTSSVLDIARNICHALHRLPLALVHAGQAILHHNLELKDYMSYFKVEARRIRLEWKRKRGRNQSNLLGRLDTDDADKPGHMSVFASFELLTIRQLSMASMDEEEFSDALQLLQVFSFLHFQNIRVDFLVHAALNPAREAEERAKGQERETEVLERLGLKPSRSWLEDLRQATQAIVGRLSFPPIIPEALKNPERLHLDDLKGQVENRVRVALRLLASRGLINRSSGPKQTTDEDGENERHTDSYNMHPLVHEWVRGRPRLSDSEKALYCQYALTILSSSVRLVGDDGERELAMRQELKPHIEHALKCSATIQTQIQMNLAQMNNPWPVMLVRWVFKLSSGPWQARMEIGETARFGKVFLECGDYKKAEELLSKVHDYLIRRLGDDNQLVHHAKLGLAIALLHQTRRKDSTVLLRDVYKSRCNTLGDRHPRTLAITTQLAESVLAQGRMTEAFDLCQQASNGLKEAYGDCHRQTIHCVNLIGKIRFFYFDFFESVEKHRSAVETALELSEKGGDTVPELDLLIYKENLAGALMYTARGTADREPRPEDLVYADELLQHVVQRREEILGKRHPYTLYGTAQYARIMAARGFMKGDPETLGKAKKLLKETLEAARMDKALGDSHLGVLAGKKWYAEVLLMKDELDEAEHYLRQATDKEQYAKASDVDGEHPDRIFHVWELVNCLERKGNFREALALCRELEANIPLVGGHGLGPNHKFNLLLAKKIEALELKLGEHSSGE